MFTWLIRILLLLLAARLLVRVFARQRPVSGPRIDPRHAPGRVNPDARPTSRGDQIAEADYEELPTEGR